MTENERLVWAVAFTEAFLLQADEMKAAAVASEAVIALQVAHIKRESIKQDIQREMLEIMGANP